MFGTYGTCFAQTWATYNAVAYRGGFFNPPPPEIPKALQNRAKLNPIVETVKNCSKILKLPPVRNCFTPAMTNKLVVIINSLKVPKITKLLLYDMKLLVPNYSCLQNTWLGGWELPPPDLRSLYSTKFVEPPPPPTKNLGTPPVKNGPKQPIKKQTK